MENSNNIQPAEHEEVHIVPYKDHFSTLVGLAILTIMTMAVSVFGADLYTLSILTALTIATTKSLVVMLYFMHLKYDRKIYRVMFGVVILLFLAFIVLTLSDYVSR